MTEGYTFKEVDAECTLHDDGRITITLMDSMDEGLLTVEAIVKRGKIPFVPLDDWVKGNFK